MGVSFTKNKATAQPCRVCLGFFYACKYLVLLDCYKREIAQTHSTYTDVDSKD